MAEGIQNRIAPLEAHLDSLSGKRREAVTKLAAQVAELQERVAVLKKEVETVRSESQERAKPEIRIAKMAYAETTLCIGPNRAALRKEFVGPIRAGIGEGRNIALR